MRVGVIGFGLIGKRRVEALIQLKKEGIPIESIVIFDPCIDMNNLPIGTVGFTDYNKFKDIYKLDWVIIAVPHYKSYDYLVDMIDRGCRILVEKPFCDSYKKSQLIFNRLRYDDQLFVGFNYRFYDGVALLIDDIQRRLFGQLISVNMNIGYGGKPEDQNSWKLNPKLAGSGSLLDPGIHMLDLMGLIFSNVVPIAGIKWNGFWNTGITENVNLLFKDDLGCSISLESSLVKWKNTFKIEISGMDGYGILEGRGGNYGKQIYIIGKRWGWMDAQNQKDSEEIICEVDCETSFYDELNALFGKNDDYLLPPCDSREALKTMELYNRCLEVLN